MASPYKIEWRHSHDQKFKWVVWHGSVPIKEILAAAASEFPDIPIEQLGIEGDRQSVILRKKGQGSY